MIFPSALVLFVGGLALRAYADDDRNRKAGQAFAAWGACLAALGAPFGGLLAPLILGLALWAALRREMGPR